MSESHPSPLDNPRLPLYLYLTGVVMVVASAWLWWAKVSIDPARVFNAMLANSLSTTSVALNLSQATNGSGAKEAIQLQFGASNLAHAITTLQENGNAVTTETIGTEGADYTRYTAVKTAKTDKQGKPIDVSNIQNVWAKTTAAEAAKNQNTPLFQQAVLGIGLPLGSIPVPMGYLQPTQRAALLSYMQENNVYSPNFSKMKKGTVNGRLAYAYPVTIQPVIYAEMMQNFAKYMGMHELDNFDPNSLSGQSAVELTFIVDVRSHHLVEIDYAANNYRETYSSYGVQSFVKLPQKTISNSELQQRLSMLQQ